MPTIYVNGDSHTAQVYPQGNSAVDQLGKRIGYNVINDALPGGSNQRIIRTTLERLPSLDPADTVIVIGWSSFERTEWYYQDSWYQICGDPWYKVPPELKQVWQLHMDAWHANERYENFRIMQEQHAAIWRFHHVLHQLGYKTLFYQGCDTFFFDGCPQQDQPYALPWLPVWVHNPYMTLNPDNSRTIENFSLWALDQGFLHSDNRSHFGQDTHDAWADYLEPQLRKLIAK